MVGAATDYALLLVARYREELHDHPSKWAAMRVAWRAAVEPIGASAATVILGLLCLMLSQLGNTRGLGPVGAIGIAGRGRRRADLPARRPAAVRPRASSGRSSRGWTTSTPRTPWAPGGYGAAWPAWSAATPAVPGWSRCWRCWCSAAFVPTFRAEGITQSQLFLNKVESVTGQEVLARHFPAGSGSPVEVVVAQEQGRPGRGHADAGTTDVSAAAVTSSRPGVPGAPPKVVDGKVLVQATLRPAADSPAAEDAVTRLRTRPGHRSARTCWSAAARRPTWTSRLASERDLRVIIPAILLVILSC